MSCPNCVRGVVLPGEPKGVMRSASDLTVDAYLASPKPAAEQWAPSTHAIVLLTDIFGLNLVNSKIMADRFSQELGCDVWVPNLFVPGPPLGADEIELPDRAGVKISWWTYLKFFWILITRLPTVFRNKPSKAAARATQFIERIRGEYKYTHVGAVGYCYGGSVLYQVAATKLIESAVIAHPGGYKDDQLKAIRVPVSWALAEDDDNIKQKQIDHAEALFAERKGKDNYVDYEFKVYPGTAHGFAARPNLAYPEVKAGFEGAFEQAVQWFKKTLF
ncbi:alpha/beta-hydrolase [Schizophyllum commune H4-8]|uniref:alpha/beta-hydrolase n=1 Tax=Schizophyllum commune (strain H4-8 / FGSC 9210) TaxID=578458 RepID=UPI00215EE336|nr:alpha/beta-hydrolase [Schizophyllum commune H4-8]KAI5896799.1 alpha/beta-hydrolase [Schizophyllum commune H4-8]